MNKRLRIALLTTWFPPVNGSFVFDQAKALAEKVDLEVFYFKFNLLPNSSSHIEDGVMVHRISFPYLPKISKATLEIWRKACSKKFLSIQKDNPFDLIHAHAYLAGFIADEIKRETSVPFFVTLHNNNLVTKTYPKLITPFLVSMIRNAQTTICVGPQLLHAVRSFNHDANFDVIPNMVDTKMFKISHKKYEGFHFVIIGHMDSRKGLNKILKAFNDLNQENVYLNIIGTIAEKGAEKLLNDNVILHGKKDRSEVAEILSKCHCLISFSSNETFGITVIEAMACGLPIIYSPSGGPEDIVPIWSGKKVSRNESSLTEEMKNMIKEHSSYDSERLRNYVVEKYDNKIIVSQLLKSYQNSI